MTDIKAFENDKMNEVFNELNLKRTHSGTSTGNEWLAAEGNQIESYTPVNGELIGKVAETTAEQYDKVVGKAEAAFKEWRKMPAPQRGEIVRQFGDKLREKKEALGMMVSYEMGKSLQEGLGEVQEMIDICDFALGLSRQLYGLTIASERPQHRMYEQWHPLGVVGIISAFNFPVAVWSWNAALALVCGNVCVWKPSEKTPLTAMVCQHLLSKVLERNELPEGISSLIQGRSEERRVGKVCRY